MRITSKTIWCAVGFGLALLPYVPASLAQQQEPNIELPPEEEKIQPNVSDSDIVTRGMRQQRLFSSTPIGGYGELHFNLDLSDTDDPESTIDLHRLVLFAAHRFTPDINIYIELEVEHALSADGQPGQVGIEQAHLDYKLLSTDSPIGEMGIRAGIVLVPMGIINQWHEPPIFHGVERPMADKHIIPTTWREGGIGLFGQPIPEIKYELYLLSGLNPGKFRAKDGIRKGRQAVAQAKTDGFAVSGRIEYEPIQSVVLGLSGYASRSGPNLTDAFAAGNKASLDVWVTGLSFDARARWLGLEARLMFATFLVDETDKLRELTNLAGESLGLDVGSQMIGGYVELAYDLLDQLDIQPQLLPFVRFEYVDTMESIEGRARTADDDDYQFIDLVFGLSFRPIAQAVYKLDVIQRIFGGEKDNQTILNLGVGFMF